MPVKEDLPSKILAEAEARADTSGRSDVADYLNLRRGNDALRQAGLDWLFATFVSAAAPHMADRPKLLIERVDGHQFSHGSSNMVGTSLQMRHGVRCLTVEAGWVRAPGDGIMRGGALAVAHVEHFGLLKASQQLRLSLSADCPVWFDENGNKVFRETVDDHIDLFLEL
jgi:hypothetical protein